MILILHTLFLRSKEAPRSVVSLYPQLIKVLFYSAFLKSLKVMNVNIKGGESEKSKQYKIFLGVIHRNCLFSALSCSLRNTAVLSLDWLQHKAEAEGIKIELIDNWLIAKPQVWTTIRRLPTHHYYHTHIDTCYQPSL